MKRYHGSGYSKTGAWDRRNAPGYSTGERITPSSVSGYSTGERITPSSVSGYSTGEVMDTSNASGYSTGERINPSNISGYSTGERITPSSVSGYSGTGGLETPNVSGHSRGEVVGGQCEDTDPRNMTAEGSRHTSDNSQQPSASEDLTSILKDVFDRITKVENRIITLTDAVNTLLPHQLHHNRALPGSAVRIQHQNKEENEMLKEENEMLKAENERLKEKGKTLEARNKELLSKVMAMHQNSEDINDPSHLSAVLQSYEMLRLQEWEKVRSSKLHPWTYEKGSDIIKKLFGACEKNIQQRAADMMKAFDMLSLNDSVFYSNQVMMREIRNLFRQHYYKNNSAISMKIVEEADMPTGTRSQNQFLLHCCQIYCLLLLQDSPIKADWNMDRRNSEHVDKKDVADWKNPVFLWPIMKCGEEIAVKGVVWDESNMF